jgi:nucleobase transporter 1/2
VNGIVNRNANGNEVPAVAPAAEPKKEDGGVAERDAKIDVYPNDEEPAHGGWRRPSGMKCGLRDNPGFG